LATLHKLNIKVAGAGRNEQEAKAPAVLNLAKAGSSSSCSACPRAASRSDWAAGDVPRQHEFGLEHGPGLPNSTIQSGAPPFANRMSELSLRVIDRIAGVAFVTGPAQVLSDGAKLDNEVLAQVLVRPHPASRARA
jgi:hypothetical protein